MKKMK